MLDTDKRQFQKRLTDKRVLYGGLLFAATAAVAIPLMNPKQIPFGVKALSVGSAIAMYGLSLTQIGEMQRLKKLADGVEVVQATRTDFAYATEAQLDFLNDAIERYSEVLDRIMALPPEFQPMFAQLAGVMIPAAPAPPPPELPPQETRPTFLEPRQEALVDTGWITEGLIRESNIVVGPKGQGKSTWIEFEATSFLALHPDGILMIIDLHYDPDDPEADQIHWFPGNDPATFMNRVIFNTLDSAWEAFCTFMSEVRDRIDSKDTKRPYMKIVVDECNGFYDRLNKGQKEYFLQETKFVEYEARKYKARQTFSFKTVKKEISKIDLSVFGSMNWLLLGNAITLESQASLPSDFNQAALSVEWQSATYKLAPISDRAKAGVLRIYGESAPYVITVPRDLPVPRLQLAPVSEAEEGPQHPSDKDLEKLLEILKAWIAELRRIPTDEELAEAFQELTERELTEEGLQLLKEKLGL